MKKTLALTLSLILWSVVASAFPPTPPAPPSVVASGKTFAVNNSLTLTATDGATLAIGGGGTLGTAAYTAATAYAPALPPEVLCTSDATVSASGSILNSYGRGGAVTSTLPTAAAGMNFMAVVGTQHNSAWKILRGGTDTMIVNGVAGKTYVQETNQAVGSAIACVAFKTAAAAWTWNCTTISGTFVTD